MASLKKGNEAAAAKREKEVIEEQVKFEKESVEIIKHHGRSAVWKYMSDVQVKDTVKNNPSIMTDALTKADHPNSVICTLCFASNKSLGQCLVKLHKGNPGNGQAHLEGKHPQIFETLDLNYRGNDGEDGDEIDVDATNSPPRKKRKRVSTKGILVKEALLQVKEESDSLKDISDNVHSVFENVSKLQSLKESVGPGDRSAEIDAMCETMIRFSRRLMENLETKRK
jgi:hypothetical protein